MMTAAQLQALSGMLAVEASARAAAGDNRDKQEIVDEVLRQVAAPDLTIVNLQISGMIRGREASPGLT